MPPSVNNDLDTSGRSSMSSPTPGSGGANILDEIRGMRVLIVDDIPTNLTLMRAMLEKGGFANLVTAQSGTEALSRLQGTLKDGANTIDAMVLDIVMPDLDGYAVCRTMRSRGEWVDIPVIMITAHERWQEHTVRAAYDSGATDIVFKPIRSQELLPRVISALSLKRERDLRKRREQELEAELAERRIIEARLKYLVDHDDLTGLCNRRRLEQALELTLQNARGDNVTSALMYLDLDQFKIINSCEGHTAGDRLLMDVANKLRQFTDPNDTLVRINSDEYALLIEHTTRDEILRRAETLRRALDEFRFTVHDTIYHISASIGVALIEPGEDLNVRDVLAHADQACLMAKTQGRNTIHLYRREDMELLNFKSNVHWVPRIRDALARDRFKLVFQPVLRIADGDIGHYEVLLRMLGNQDELLEPMEFIRVAERMGLIHDIDHWVIRNAVRVLHELPAEYSHLALNINLSGHAFQDPMLLPLIQEELSRTGVAARRITFEITETATIANFAKTREMVNQIRALGCRFALDDFGAGFNTFNYMKQFPVDYLKIDGTFITNLAGDPVDQALVKSMVDIARTLGKETIAEFVENERNLNLLKELGVDYAQGYYIGRPSPQFG